MTLLGQNGHGQWKHDPDRVRRQTIIGVVVGGTIVLAVLIFVLVYFVVISPPKPDIDNEDSLQSIDNFTCSSD